MPGMNEQSSSESGEVQPISVVFVTMSVGAVILLFMLVFGIGRVVSKGEEQDKSEEVEEKKKPKKENQQSKRKSQPAKKGGRKSFNHPLLACTLKEHGDNILDLDFSINGKYLASCSEDRTVRLWSVKEFKEKEHKCVRGNVEYDHATRVKFSPDCKAFITSLAVANNVRVFKVGKKEDGSNGVQISAALEFPKNRSQDIIDIGLGANPNGSFIMTAYRDTTIDIWDTKGEVLATLDTHHMTNNYAAVSPCGRFVASCGFTPDVKVWEVVFSKNGDFSEVRRAMELKGHKASVYYFSFNLDSTRTATVSKDGTWKLWDTEVEYNKNQDPHLLYTGNYNHMGPSMIALAPDANSLAIAYGNRLWLFNTNTGEEDQSFEDVHTQPISKVAFDPSSRYVATTGDRHLRVFHNVAGYRANILDMETKMKKSTTSKALKERLEHQIKETRNALSEILGETKEE